MTNTEQAVALAEKHGWKQNRGDFVFNTQELTALLSDHRQQVIEELANKAGVMPGEILPDACDTREVREAIAAMQAKVESLRDALIFAASWIESGRQLGGLPERMREAALRGEAKSITQMAQ